MLFLLHLQKDVNALVIDLLQSSEQSSWTPFIKQELPTEIPNADSWSAAQTKDGNEESS